jgi:hypothetical protein
MDCRVKPGNDDMEGLAKHAAQQTLVVKISDTSLHGKAGSNPAFDARTGRRPGEG